MKIKGHLKRLASALVAVIIAVLSLLPMAGGTLTVEALASAFTEEDGAEWALERAAEGWYVDFDGIAGCQCVDLIKEYYKILGYGEPIANANQYVSELALPSGWKRVYDDPHPGDIFAWVSGKWGHVGIVTAVHGDYVDTVETNSIGNEYVGSPAEALTEPISKIDCFIRPNFSRVPEQWTTDGRNYKVATNTDPLNMRSSASQSASVITQIPKGTIVTVMQTRNGWGQVRYGTQIGYCMMEWLTLASEADKSSNPEENKKTIYNYLTKDLGLPVSAACGILGNIHVETGGTFDPESHNPNDSGGTESYGICQWNSGEAAGNRMKELQAFTTKWKTLEGQLDFIKHDLKYNDYLISLNLYNDLKALGNTESDAITASNRWASDYEGCAVETYEERRERTRDYWKVYGKGGETSTQWKSVNKTYIVTTQSDDLNMRSAPSISDNIIASIPNGSEVVVISISDNGVWGNVKWNGKVGYCMMEYLTEKKTAPTTTTPPAQTTAKTTTTTKTTTSVTTISYPKPVLDRTITEGNYRIQSQNGYHMTVYKQRETDTGHSMVVDMYDGLETQHFALTYHGKGQYTLASGIDPDQNLNNTCAKPENIREGIPVTCWDELENDERQRFYITPVEYTNDNEVIYVIQSVRHPELVVTPEYQDERLSDLKLQKYDANNKAQKWTFKEPMLPTLEVTQPIASGDYKIRNAQLGFIMTKHGEDEPDTDGIWAEMDMSLQSQRYTLKYISEGKYALAVGGESNRFVGCKTSSAGKVKAGDPLYSMELNKDGTQYFWITYVGDDQYILQSALNRKLVIAPKSADSSTFLELQEYDHSLAQRWKLQKAPVAATTTAAPTKSVKTTTTTAKTTTAPEKTTAVPKTTTATRTTATAALTTSVAVTTTAASKTTSESITLTNGEQYTINKKNMTFKSNNPDVAVVSPSGVITAVGTGGAIISMIDADSNVTQIRITVKAVGEAPAENIGDLNGDNEIGVDDAQITLKAYTERIAGKKTGLTDVQMKAADVDGNGEVSVEDAQLILKYYTEKVVAGKDITWKNILGK